MTSSLQQTFQQAVTEINSGEEQYIANLVDAILREAQAAGASDVHLVPGRRGLQMDWRIDGVLQPVAHLKEVAPNVVARLKVLAQLLTYRTDVPQEGRILERLGGGDQPRVESGRQTDGPGNPDVEMRVSTFPTLHGEKAVVRLFVGSGRYRRLGDLGLPEPLGEDWSRLITATSGVLLISGPAGSGKTTTLYASLREILCESPDRRSVVSLEDPIEAEVPGVAQSQVNAAAGFDCARGLRSLLRQDPEVIMVGEIRDRETAETVFQASLTGHLVLTSFHAGTSAEAMSRVGDLGVEPYLLRSGLSGILSQRLLRRLCDCALPCDDPEQALALPVRNFRIPSGCEACAGTGYAGRMLIAELLQPEANDLSRSILARADVTEIERQAVKAGMETIDSQACRAVERGDTSPAEVRRVFGVRRGFTLVELMVVSAIIAILVALLLPAVQQAREAARRAACKNNLRQLGVALEAYDDQFEMFPAGTINPEGPIRNEPSGYHHNWVIALLPHLEQRPLAGQINTRVGVYDLRNREARRTRIPMLLCPSDAAGVHASLTGERLEPALTNYAGCHHPIEAPIDDDNWGVLYLNSFLRIPQIADGTSKTIAFGEIKRAMDDLGWASGTRATLRNTWLPINVTPGGGAYYDDVSFHETALSDQGGAGTYLDEFDITGMNPERGRDGATSTADSSSSGVEGDADAQRIGNVELERGELIEAAELPPDLKSLLTENPSLIVGGFGSSHPGGAHFVLSDGSVHFMSENIDPDIYHRLGDRADGQLVSGPSSY